MARSQSKDQSEDKENGKTKVTYVRQAAATCPGDAKVMRQPHECKDLVPATGGPLPRRTNVTKVARDVGGPHAPHLHEPGLLSVHRLGDRILNAREEINSATPDVAAALVDRRLLESPSRRLQVDREASSGVNFCPNEELYTDLQSLTVDEDAFAEACSGRLQRARPKRGETRHSRAPTMDDFDFQPYEGEDVTVDDPLGDEEAIFRALVETAQRRRGPPSQQEWHRDQADFDRRFSSHYKDWGFG